MEYLDPQSTQPRLVGSRTPNTCWRERRPRLLEDKTLILPLGLTFEGSLGEGAKGPAEEGDLEVSGGRGAGEVLKSEAVTSRQSQVEDGTMNRHTACTCRRLQCKQQLLTWYLLCLHSIRKSCKSPRPGALWLCHEHFCPLINLAGQAGTGSQPPSAFLAPSV